MGPRASKQLPSSPSRLPAVYLAAKEGQPFSSSNHRESTYSLLPHTHNYQNQNQKLWNHVGLGHTDACACAWARRREIGETERGPSSPPPPSSARCPDERLNAVRPTLNWAPMLRGAPECRGFATRNDPEMQTAGTSSL